MSEIWKRIPEDSPKAYCLNDLDHRIWKTIAERRRGDKGDPHWVYFDQLDSGERVLLGEQIREGHVITITGTYGERCLLFAKFPKLG